MKRIRLGATDLEITELGIGAWQWGDTRFWGYDRDYGENDVRAAMETTLASHINFLDTAELYGFGKSERLVGKYLDGQRSSLIIASKSPSLMTTYRALLFFTICTGPCSSKWSTAVMPLRLISCTAIIFISRLLLKECLMTLQ